MGLKVLALLAEWGTAATEEVEHSAGPDGEELDEKVEEEG